MPKPDDATGDQHLLKLERLRGVSTTSPRAFLDAGTWRRDGFRCPLPQVAAPDDRPPERPSPTSSRAFLASTWKSSRLPSTPRRSADTVKDSPTGVGRRC